ncbi:MAG: NAD-dependent epimerase/dehydratase family protein [Pirellulaceae bacterium]|nr:NAD-dependent epimerase/dehydratase family protein [Pirellulaceae bacterium]
MISVLVTGSDGLLGWHVRCFLSTLKEVKVIACNRSQFNDAEYLAEAVKRSDAVVHLAGMNRGNEQEVAKTNVALADQLVAACQATNAKPHVLYSSSTHADGQSSYGVSKRTAHEHLEAWAHACGAAYCNLILPHIFGEHGKPFYNSVVSTFAYQLSQDLTPEIKSDGQLSLLHAQDVAALIWKHIGLRTSGTERPLGTPISVTALLERLQGLIARYRNGVVPLLSQPLDLRLFNTFRSYCTPEQRAHSLKLHTDNRGALFESIRSDGCGQVFLSTTHPGITRGNHFHTRKVERFVVIEGEAEIKMRRMLTAETHTYRVSGTAPQAIDIPTLHTHMIKNVGNSPLLTMFWAGEHFDPQDPDTYFCEVDEAVS